MKMNKTLIYIFLFLCIANVKAANSSINKIIATISDNNTDIKATIAQLASDSIEISSTNYLEDPSVDFEYLFGSKSIGDKWAIGISQGFDWPGIYGSRRRANKSKLSALAYSANMKRLEILSQAKLLCLDLVKINKQIDVWQKVYDNYSRLYDNYTLALKKREITILDINKLRIELVNTKQTLANLKITHDEIIENLKALNGNNQMPTTLINELIEYPNDKLQPLDMYVKQFNEHDPESNYYAEMNNAFNAERSVARMGWLPKFSIGYKYSNEIGDGFNGFTIGVSIPIFANRKKTKAAKAQEIANVFTINSVENTNMARIKSTFAKAVSLKSQLSEYQAALDFNTNNELLQKALENGQISLLDFIRETIYFLDAEQQMLDIEYEYNCTIAELNKYSLIAQ